MRNTKRISNFFANFSFVKLNQQGGGGINFSDSWKGENSRDKHPPAQPKWNVAGAEQKVSTCGEMASPALHNFRNCDSGLFNQTRWTRTCLHATPFAEKQPTSMKIDLETAPLILFHREKELLHSALRIVTRRSIQNKARLFSFQF